MEIKANDFDVTTFIQNHQNDYVIFVTGGWNYLNEQGYYKCLLLYNGYSKTIQEDLYSLKSPNVAMLKGVIAACRLLKKENTNLYLITPTALGFKKGQKGKGVNVKLVHEVLDICQEKRITLHDISLYAGGEIIKYILHKSL